jgi:hypothetical protein
MMATLGYEGEKCTLYSAESHVYAVAAWAAVGIICTDPQNITAPAEFAEGAMAILIFKVPKNETPTKLTFVYSFKETWQETEKRGQIDIPL